MIQLQNNFTTPEQSKRLLKLGVPADSADCYYSNSIPHSEREDYRTLHILPFGSDSTISSLKEIAEEEGGFVIPCWSVGRLMEIFDMCCIKVQSANCGWCSYQKLHEGQTYTDYILYVFTINKMQDLLDFSKLENKI